MLEMTQNPAQGEFSGSVDAFGGQLGSDGIAGGGGDGASGRGRGKSGERFASPMQQFAWSQACAEAMLAGQTLQVTVVWCDGQAVAVCRRWCRGAASAGSAGLCCWA